VLRSWIKSLDPGEGGWLGAIVDTHIGRALQLIRRPLHLDQRTYRALRPDMIFGKDTSVFGSITELRKSC
jgi:hypothetical protein